ncbi:predicted protein [Nematostella vectensis]|uniref:Ras-related protein Rab-12 n=1 Tax=Nematostella vectensis TaxID=45351 RepID=A7S7D8_NEMVE|nr:predicted protein [Nematostella vectensis]|eukprot:XP_001632471.1 predicted protein [Nematostella vectensis]
MSLRYTTSLAKKREYDLQYKVIVIGESGVGKSSLIRCYAHPDQPFCSNMITTVGIDFVKVDTKVDELIVRLQIWDTAGQERFRTMTTMQFRGTKGILLVYDITCRKSFDNLQFWLESIRKNKLQYEEILLVGNKCDVGDDREVPKRKGEELAKHHGIKFIETSAKTRINVKEAFCTLATQMKDANDPFVHVRNEDTSDQADGIIQPSEKDFETSSPTSSYQSSYCCSG